MNKTNFANLSQKECLDFLQSVKAKNKETKGKQKISTLDYLLYEVFPSMKTFFEKDIDFEEENTKLL